jgi:hypothetical protein
MAIEEQALILRDREGQFYVIPQAVLAARRVPAEQQATGMDEVAGYIASLGPASPGSPPITPSYGYSYSYGPAGFSYAYWYTLPSPPAPGPRAPGQIVGL